jgi:hypothetical protein
MCLKRNDAAIALAGAVACVLLASIVMTGWPSGLVPRTCGVPNLRRPFACDLDSLIPDPAFDHTLHHRMVRQATLPQGAAAFRGIAMILKVTFILTRRAYKGSPGIAGTERQAAAPR